ncbi:unnamed protein product, partial [Ectocarpus sp. 8 AP-2014]
ARGVGWGGGFPKRKVAGSEEGDLRAFRVQNFLALRSLHQWLVGEGPPSDDGTATAIADAASSPICFPPPGASARRPPSPPPPRPPPPPPPPTSSFVVGSVRVDKEFLALVGVIDDVDDGQSGGVLLENADRDPSKHANSGREEETAYFPRSRSGSDSFSRTSGGAAAPPRPGGRVELSGKLCLACCLPFNWPGTMAAEPPASATRVSTAAAAARKRRSAGAAAAPPTPVPTQNGGGSHGGRVNGGGMFSGLLYGPALWTGTAASPTNGGGPSPGSGGSSQQRRRRQQQHQHHSPRTTRPPTSCALSLTSRTSWSSCRTRRTPPYTAASSSASPRSRTPRQRYTRRTPAS